MKNIMHMWRGMLVAILVLGLAVVGCNRAEPVDEAEVRAYADSMVENILQSMKEGDYTGFSRDFDRQMKSALTESVFLETHAGIQKKIGEYISKEFWKVYHEDDLVVTYYRARFTGEEEDVFVQAVFQETDGKICVAGFLLDSPKLRKE
jgi:hypothetical protein